MYKRRIGWFGLLLLLLGMSVSWATSAAEWQPIAATIRKSEHDVRQYQAIKLANEMVVLLVSDQDAPKSLAALALPVGSLQDPHLQQGLAHYLEHMVLMGSKKYPEPDNFANYLNKHAGKYNASTAPYHTAYYLEVENSAFAPAVDRLADAIAEPLLDPLYADRERNAVNAELTMARARDGMRMAQVDAETINQAHPAAQFFGGNLQTLSDKPESKLHSELLAFYQRYYSAAIMVGVLYSNQSLAELAQLATDTFGRIPLHAVEIPAITVPAVTEQEQGLIIHYVPVQPTKLLRIDFRIPDNSLLFRSKIDNYIAYLLSNHSADTLADWLQTQGLADNISAGSEAKAEGNGGVFRISVSLTDKGLAQRERVVNAVFDYLRLIQQQGISADYFAEIEKVLTLDFRYQSIKRDMNYIEWLADAMLRMPVDHVLDGYYLADQYKPEAIAERLRLMTPDRARIWYISPQEPTDKKAYFVEAAYQVEKITAEQLHLWQTAQVEPPLRLPELNPYLPDDFTLIDVPSIPEKPQWVLQEASARALFTPSHYFANEPKAVVTIALRNRLAEDTAEHQVLFALTDYLASLQLAQLSYQAAIGGIDFSTYADHGLVIGVNGFTQRLPELLQALIQQYQSVSPSEEELQQAKSWYRQKLEAADKSRAYMLSVRPINGLSQVPYFEMSERLAQLDSITIADIVNYRQQLLTQAAIEVISVGNLTAEQVAALVTGLQQQLQNHGTVWWHGEQISVDKMYRASLQRSSGSSDSALAAFYLPTGYTEIASITRSRLVAQILHPWFFNQLRTEEQLGYAVFASAMPVSRQWGISFILQSNTHSPAALYQRYLAFFTEAKLRLLALSPEEFQQYKQSMIQELQQRPQTLAEEAGRYQEDVNRSNYQFDSRKQVIAELEALSQSELYRFYKRSVLENRGLTLLSQVSGSESERSAGEFIVDPTFKVYHGAAELQQQLPEQVEP